MAICVRLCASHFARERWRRKCHHRYRLQHRGVSLDAGQLPRKRRGVSGNERTRHARLGGIRRDEHHPAPGEREPANRAALCDLHGSHVGRANPGHLSSLVHSLAGWNELRHVLCRYGGREDVGLQLQLRCRYEQLRSERDCQRRRARGLVTERLRPISWLSASGQSGDRNDCDQPSLRRQLGHLRRPDPEQAVGQSKVHQWSVLRLQ